MIPVEEIREPPGKAMGKVAEGQVGFCGIRGVHEGKLWLYVYGRVITGHVDPIEKKPVSHYRPGSKIFSIATTGCNATASFPRRRSFSRTAKLRSSLSSLRRGQPRSRRFAR